MCMRTDEGDTAPVRGSQERRGRSGIADKLCLVECNEGCGDFVRTVKPMSGSLEVR